VSKLSVSGTNVPNRRLSPQSSKNLTTALIVGVFGAFCYEFVTLRNLHSSELQILMPHIYGPLKNEPLQDGF
jgi:hypothetical protein